MIRVSVVNAPGGYMSSFEPDNLNISTAWIPDGSSDKRYDYLVGARLVDENGSYLVDAMLTRIFIGGSPVTGKDVDNSGVWTVSQEI